MEKTKEQEETTQLGIGAVSEEVYLKNHGWQKLLSQGEIGNHEGLSGIYYLVDGFGKVHEKYCKHFR